MFSQLFLFFDSFWAEGDVHFLHCSSVLFGKDKENGTKNPLGKAKKLVAECVGLYSG
jgi:hypothetical protein